MQIELYENKNDSLKLINVGLLFFLYEQVQFDSSVLDCKQMIWQSIHNLVFNQEGVVMVQKRYMD